METAKKEIPFGSFVKERREELGKSLRGLAADLDMTPAYLSDIEKGNRYAPEKRLKKMVEVLELSGDGVNMFYDLAGQSRNNNFTDLSEYLGSRPIARVALRKARDMEITDSQWREIIKGLSEKK